MFGSSVLSGRYCVVAAALCAASVVLAAPADAKRRVRPNLVERSVSDPTPSSGQVGAHFTVRDVVKNAGRKTAPKSVTTFCLNGRQEIGCGWFAGSRTVPALKPGKKSRKTTNLTIPSGLADDTGSSWWVIACSDGPAKVKESNENDNCKLAAGKITVEASPSQGAGGFPTYTSYPGLQGTGSFSFHQGDPYTNLNFEVSFSSSVTGFEMWVPGDYVSGTILSPETTSCGGNDQEVHYGKTYTKLYCVFANELPAGTQASGTMSVTPDPAPGAGGYLYGFEGYDQAQESGPFTMTGP